MFAEICTGNKSKSTCTPVTKTCNKTLAVQVTEGPKKTGDCQRKGYTMVEEDDEDDEVDLNVQMIPLQDDHVSETGIDCTLTQEAEEAGDVYAPYLPVSLFDLCAGVAGGSHSRGPCYALRHLFTISRGVHLA